MLAGNPPDEGIYKAYSTPNDAMLCGVRDILDEIVDVGKLETTAPGQTSHCEQDGVLCC